MKGKNSLGTGTMAKRFTEDSDNATGNKSSSAAPSSYISKNVERCLNDIAKIAKRDAKSVQQVASDILSQSDGEINNYIVAKSEIPATTPNKRAVQAALLRMDDIATVASASDISDADAEKHIQEAESEALEINSPDANSIMKYDTQAALKIVYDTLVQKLGASGITGASITANRTVAQGLNNSFDLSDLLPSTPAASSGAVVSSPPAAATPIDGGDDDDTSIWDVLDDVVSNAGSISKAASSIGNTISSTAKNVSNTIGTTGSNIGAASISQYLQQNGIMIIVVILVIVLTIILIARATRSN